MPNEKLLTQPLIDISFRLDCGMSHVTDEECREHLLKIVPENEKESIQTEKFGEIKDKYALLPSAVRYR